MADPRLYTERERAAQARTLTEHPLWLEAWAAWEQTALKEWRNTATGDSARREQLWMAMDVAGKVRRHIERIIETGRMAEQAIADEERKHER